MNKEQVRKIVDEVVESLLEGGPGSGRYPPGSGKNPTPEDNVGGGKSATDGVARHAPGKGNGSLKDRLKRRVAVGGPEHDDNKAHHDAYDKAPGKITTKGGTVMYKAGWDNHKKTPVYVTVPGRD